MNAPKSNALPIETAPDRCEVVQLGARLVRGEKARTLKLTAELPKGISLGERHDGRAKPYFLRSGAYRKVTSFTTERQRNDAAAALWERQKEAGVSVVDEFDGVLWRKMTELLKRTGASLEELERAWEAYAHGASGATVEETVTRYIALRKTEGLKEKSDTYRHLRKHLVERLSESLGSRFLSDITTQALREWADGLKDDDGKPLGPVTRRHHLITIKTFFDRARREGWILRNPAEAIVLPKLEEKDVNVISVRDAFHVFKANRDHRSIGRLALEAFGVLRRASAGKAKEEHIQKDVQGIFMPGRDHKSTKRKFRQGQPANLWEWLDHAPNAGWDVTNRSYADDKTEMHVNAGLRPMILKSDEDRKKAERLRNVWRHSCISYLLAKLGSTPAVSRLAQHSNLSTTEGYEGVATRQNAELYFAITPASVLLTWEQFVATYSNPSPAPQST